jgi:hypothetical protein
MTDSDLTNWYNFGPGRVEQAESGTGTPITQAERAKANKRTDKATERIERKLRKR